MLILLLKQFKISVEKYNLCCYYFMHFDSVILDIDGTIWYTTCIVAEAWNRAIDKLYPQVPHVTAKILHKLPLPLPS